ncbi:MAG: hypothetical protein CL946_06965 [Ectothiorhodospiraceae bacterium]|nr:hypothetical protein [Ectothiorhodospiraceae bacterium]
MPVSKGTKTAKKDVDFSPLFPPKLVGKQLKRNKEDIYGINENCQLYLEQYLESKNPNYLVKALIECPALLNGKRRKPDIKEYLKEFREKCHIKSSYVDALTIADESIKWWQHLHNWMGDDEKSNLAKKYLIKVAPLLVLPKIERKVLDADEYFEHQFPKVKGQHPSLVYKSPIAFMDRWNQVMLAFNETKSKTRYSLGDNKAKEQDAINAIRILGNELNDDDVKFLDLTNIMTKTVSYIRFVHELRCPICLKKGLSDKTITRLLRKAKEGMWF